MMKSSRIGHSHMRRAHANDRPRASRAASFLALTLPMLAGVATAASPAPALAETVAQAVSGLPPVQGEALKRSDSLIAANAALAAENQAPTAFHNVVGLDDPDVVARAHTLTIQAGHGDLNYDYFRFKALFDKARAAKADKVDIPAGAYRIYPPQNFPAGQGLIEASGLSHAVIDGHGATVSFASIGTAQAPLDKVYPRAGIHMSRADHVTLRNFVMDWYEPLAVPVRVGGTGLPGSPQTLTVDPAFPVDPQVPIPLRGVMPYNVPQRKFVLSRELGPDDFAVWQREHSPQGSMAYLCPAAISGVPASTCFRYIGHQTYAFGATERLSPVPSKPGNFIATVRDNNFAAIVADGASSYLTISAITIYNSPGAGVVVINSGRATHVDHVRIVRKPDALLAPGEQPRFISTLSDGMDVINSAGDVVIEDCEIANQADDGLNIRAAMVRAIPVDTHTFQAIAGAVDHFYRVGGLVDVYDDKGINVLASKIAIAAIVPPAPGSRKYTVTLAGTMPPLRRGFAYQIRVLDWDNDNVVVRRSWFHDSTERGVVVHDADVAIVGNRFERTAESAVQVLYDNQSGTAEGAVASNVIIAGNLIQDVNVGWFDPALRSVAAPAAIAVYFGARSGLAGGFNAPLGNVVADHLAIADNVIQSVPGLAILVSQANDVILARNQTLHSGQHHFGLPLVDGNAILVEKTTNLIDENNNTDLLQVVK